MTILTSGAIAGTMDAEAAILLYAKPVNLHNISKIFRYIATGSSVNQLITQDHFILLQDWYYTI